eukprot:gene10505-11606_t
MTRPGNIKRGDLRKQITENLSKIVVPKFECSPRSIREDFQVLFDRREKINTEKEKTSGISPDPSEEDQLVDELIEVFTTAAVDQQEAEKVKSNKKEVEIEKAKEARQQSLETFGETRKRRAEEGKGKELMMKKKRVSVGKDTFAFLEKKMKEDIEVKWKDNLEVRHSLIEQHLQQQNQIIVQLLQNQNQFSQMLTDVVKKLYQ